MIAATAKFGATKTFGFSSAALLQATLDPVRLPYKICFEQLVDWNVESSCTVARRIGQGTS